MDRHECSYGIIPLKTQNDNEWSVLLIQHHAGHWSFPKGHPEEGESPEEAAIRELKEETGLSFLRIISPMTIEENYTFCRDGITIIKKVVFFLGEVTGSVHLQESEIARYAWVSLEEASKLVTFSESHNTCKRVIELLYGHRD